MKKVNMLERGQNVREGTIKSKIEIRDDRTMNENQQTNSISPWDFFTHIYIPTWIHTYIVNTKIVIWISFRQSVIWGGTIPKTKQKLTHRPKSNGNTQSTPLCRYQKEDTGGSFSRSCETHCRRAFNQHIMEPPVHYNFSSKCLRTHRCHPR